MFGPAYVLYGTSASARAATTATTTTTPNAILFREQQWFDFVPEVILYVGVIVQHAVDRLENIIVFKLVDKLDPACVRVPIRELFHYPPSHYTVILYERPLTLALLRRNA